MNLSEDSVAVDFVPHLDSGFSLENLKKKITEHFAVVFVALERDFHGDIVRRVRHCFVAQENSVPASVSCLEIESECRERERGNW